MREFKDEEGRPWRVALTCASVMRVADMVSIDVVDEHGNRTKQPFNMGEASNIGQTLQAFRSQYTIIGEVLYAILVNQIEERKITKDEFLESIKGDSLGSAIKVIEQELVDFFPYPHQRKLVGAILANMDSANEQIIAQAIGNLEVVAAESIAEASGMPSGKQRESSECIQANGQSGNSLQLETAA